MKLLKVHIVFFILLVGVQMLFAQRTDATFGQSRVQYENFKWKHFSTPSFDIYYYQKGEKLAQAVAEYAEEDYRRITTLLGYYSYKKIKLIVYNSITDKDQSNIGLTIDRYQTGTETHYLKNKVEISFNSTQAKLKEDVTLQLSRVLINEMIYGQGMRELIQSSYFIALPEWFSEGLAQYITYGWSEEMDNYMRVGKMPANMSAMNNLRGKSAALVGQSMWTFIVEKHGSNAITNIFTFVRLSRDERMAITNTLDISYKDLYQHYFSFYNRNALEGTENLPTVSELHLEERSRYKSNYFNAFALSPDGSKLAYATYAEGKQRVYLKDLNTGKTKKMFKQGVKNLSDMNREKLPLLTWRNNEDLFIIYRGENEWSFFKDDQLIQISGNSLILRNLTGKGRRKYLKKYEQIQSLSFSPKGDQMLLSVVDDGQSDILLYMPKINQTLPLTNDFYDDIDPRFLSDGKVLFSSNRTLEDEGFSTPTSSDINTNFDIFLLDVYAEEDRIRPLSTSLSAEIMPQPAGDSAITYLGNDNGITSLYLYSFADGSTKRLQTFQESISDYHIVGAKIALTADEGKGSGLYVDDNYQSWNTSTFEKTTRQKTIEERSYALIESIDTTSVLPKSTSKKTKSAPYSVTYSINQLHSGIKIDPLLGLGPIFDVTLTDMMENHRINGGIFVLADFGSTSIYGEYQYLKKRLDYKLKYQRDNFLFFNSAGLKYAGQSATGGITLPFNYANKIALEVGWVQTRATFLDPVAISTQDFATDFINGKLSYVLDNTVKEGLNMLKGTRMRAELNGMLPFRTSIASRPRYENFLNFSFDIRNYKEVGKTFTWANRLTMGRSMGNAPKTFIFGGMDNWFGPKQDLNETPPIQYPADILYLNYVTSVRGFNYNVRNGNNFILFNSEWRLPYTKLTSFSTYKSHLINNLQFVFFTDVGTAWSSFDASTFTDDDAENLSWWDRNSPTSQHNSIHKSNYGNASSPFQIVAYNYRSPLVLGFGGGVRTVVLGTYTKIDIAWGVEDLKIRGPKAYLTLGYDF